MKYGDALPLRSVQEWLPYNLDYAEIKQLIKHYTTKSLPVTTPDRHTDFEDEVFEVFVDQLGRIDLFVKSKAGEIDRRVSNCERQILELRRQTPTLQRSAKIVNRYARIEQEVERAGRDVQSLSRFVNVQRTAFHKLLKKYRKWSGSAQLPDRFTILLESPTAFHRHDFDQNVFAVSELLMACRQGISSLSDETFLALDEQDFSTCRAEHHTPQRYPRTRLELDTAFGTSRITNSGGRAVFWVHNDHIIELQVFLLKHLNPQSSTPALSVPPTPLASRRNSNASIVAKDDHVGLVVFDDFSSFSNVQNTATIDKVSKSAMRTAGQIRWCAREPEASMVVSSSSASILDVHSSRSPEMLEVRMKRKQVELVLDPKADSPILEATSIQQRQNIERIREWLRKHPGVKPLAKILSRRTRYMGPLSGGQAWAYMDRDIRMISNDGESGWVVSDDEGSGKEIDFPHAVVEIQWDGKQTPAFVHDLSQSHIVEGVPGFSLDVHAIAALYEPKGMLRPFWFSALSQDIRKTPNRRPAHSRRSSSRVVFSNTSSKNSSVITGDSVQQYQHSTPGTSDAGPFSQKKKKQKTSGHGIERPSITRYWSEFDDDDREEPYTILVRPSTPDSMDDGLTEQSLSAFITSPIVKAFSRVRHACRKKRQQPEESSPLLGGSPGQDSESESENEVTARVSSQQNYATFRSVSRRRIAYSASHVGFLLMSVLMLVVTGALAVGESLSGHKRKRKNIGKHIAVDLSVFVGVLICVISGVIGLTIFVVGRAGNNWLHTLSVWITFSTVCAGCGAILTIVSRDIVGEA